MTKSWPSRTQRSPRSRQISKSSAPILAVMARVLIRKPLVSRGFGCRSAFVVQRVFPLSFWKRIGIRTGPGGEPQCRTEGTSSIRLATDIALLEDTAYKMIVEPFAADQSAFDAAFDTAWVDLETTNVGGELPGRSGRNRSATAPLATASTSRPWLRCCTSSSGRPAQPS